ncbi:unnamed protein product [Allacma fusca]|uniref:Tyrosine-protein phosphatase non-receptor type 9 n=1 Tax=Allacma fusca TaxID=39272 RepID=A0A8J2MB32_9HEXA|nr:unnamed protein product [Allacma fusca]
MKLSLKEMEASTSEMTDASLENNSHGPSNDFGNLDSCNSGGSENRPLVLSQEAEPILPTPEKVAKGLSLSLTTPAPDPNALLNDCEVTQVISPVSCHQTNPGSAALSDSEEQCTREFLELVNGARLDAGMSPLSWNAGVKFLMARKFNVRRALELYEQHHKTRLQERLTTFDPYSEPLKSELMSQKFTVLPSRDLGGAAIAVFTARSHLPSTVPHEQTLQGVVYQLDAALEDPQTQRSGLVFIYDMSESKYSNFDYDLSIKILTLLKGSYPARLKKVLIVTAPLWFRAPFRILRLFVREKLRDRVFTVSLPQLGVHIPNSSLPRSLGGQLEVNHALWLDHCHRVLSTTDLWGGYDESHRNMASRVREPTDVTDEEVESAVSNGHENTLAKKLRRNGQSTPSPAPNSSGSSGFSDDDSLPFDERTGLTISEFVEHLKQKGRRGLLDEYSEIVSKTPDGSFGMSRLRGNICKNRYSDVLCFDHTRVVLSSEGEPGESDYINANFVDGYKQKHAFISTQGPLPRTFGDFWKMIWEQTCVLIVMTTRIVERGRTKCGQYWPAEKGSTSPTYEGFKIENLDVETRTDLELTRLCLTNMKTNESRNITHLQFLSWPDYGVPSSPAAMLTFLDSMRSEQNRGIAELGAKWDGHPLGPPIVAHCSAGIGRTGTLITMDICIRRHQDQGTVDVQGTVERIRSQRAYSIQVPEQYLFCHAAMIEYAKSKDLLTDDQLDGVPDLLAEDFSSLIG